MAVHSLSLIPTWVNSLDPTLYTKLTSMETYCYSGLVDGVVRPNDNFDAWKPLFTNLVSALNSWKNSNRQSLLNDIIPLMYSYNMLNFLYGTGNGLNTANSNTGIFTLNGLRTTIPARADSYYNDITTNAWNKNDGSYSAGGSVLTSAAGGITGATYAGGTLTVYHSTTSASVYTISGTPTATQVTIVGTFPSLGTGKSFSLGPAAGATSTSTKLTADVTSVNAAAAAESSTFSTNKTAVQAVISSHVNKSLFEDIPISGSNPGKSGLATQIFNTMGYKTIYQQLNVGSLVLPPGV